MKQLKLTSNACAIFAATTQISLALLAACLFTLPVRAEDRRESKPALAEHQFQDKLRTLERLKNSTEQAREANSLLRDGWLSSLQVKALARTITQEDARYDFALAAYPRTVDPENFYEVYDAFTSYSKVFRLHDRIREFRAPATPPAHVGIQPISDEAMADLLKAVRAESFDDTKKAVVRQMFAGKRRFLSRQVGEIVRLFSFDNARLEIAKLAYDSVVDPENYYQVSQVLDFTSNKDALARYIESRNTQRTSRPEH